MVSAVAKPISRKQLRELALTIRKKVGLENDPYFPVLKFIEFVLPSIFLDFYLEIGTEFDMGNCHGITCREENCIKIREDVYSSAFYNGGKDRFTCAHEVGHFFIHDHKSVQLARLEYGQKVESFRDPEWQANAFAGELLVPIHLVEGMSVYEVSEICGVSEAAARIQLNAI